MGSHGEEPAVAIPDAVRRLSLELGKRYGRDYNCGRRMFEDGQYGGDHFGPGNAQRWKDSARGVFDALKELHRNRHYQPLLDLGCGRGVLTNEIRAFNIKAFGLDLGQDVETVGAVGNAICAPFATSTFAVILALDIIEHLPMDAQPRLWWEIRRLLRPGGLLLATVPTETPHYARFSSEGVYNHYVSLSPVRWKDEVIQPGGFSVLAEGGRLALFGPPFNHGPANYPFALVAAESDESLVRQDPRPAGDSRRSHPHSR